MVRGWDESSAKDESIGDSGVIDGNDDSLPQKTAEIGTVSGFFPWDRDQPGGSSFFIDDAYGHFIGDDGGDTRFRRIPGDGDHVQSH